MSTKSIYRSIILFCPEKSGLAYMMAGYLHFYKSDLKLALSEECKLNHPIAIQVMQEDGINVNHLTSNLNQVDHLLEPIIKIHIEYSNKKKNIYQVEDLQSPFQIYINDPLENNSYDELVEEFRKTREEIKKISIEIAGAL